MQNFVDIDFASLQLDSRIPDFRSTEQLEKHVLEEIYDQKPVERAIYILQRGDEIQKLSVIHSLPSLLEGDSQGCLTRVIPKMQQSLPTASTEFHLAASSTFKNILEQNLVSYSIFTRTFLQSILNSLESRDPVISHAWLETLLDVIALLPVDVIKEEILPRAINKGQLMQPVASRVICCKMMGKICTRFDSILIKKEVLPTIYSLCQDVSSDVRASICLQLHYVAGNLDPETVMSALLPSLVELSNDEESAVRYASVQAIVDLLPHLQEDIKKNTIVPLVKKLFESALKSNDNVIIIISQVFGKFVLEIEKSLSKIDHPWFIQCFQKLARLGTSKVKKESSQDDFMTIDSISPSSNEKYVGCRRNCAFNFPAMFLFVSAVGDVNELLPTFSDLANDPYYLVRKIIACSIHEVANILDTRSDLIKTDFLKLLKSDSIEVLQGVVPHIGTILLLFVRSKTIGPDQVIIKCLSEYPVKNKLLEWRKTRLDKPHVQLAFRQKNSSVTEFGKALLKCESEISRTNNWRLSESMIDQLQVLPQCFSSDYIYTVFVPLIINRVLYARPVPVRLAAGRTLLVYLRYNLQSLQRAEMRNKILAELARSQNCYTRMLFIRIMNEALSLFSSVYFKEHFFSILLSMTDDSVANIRLKVVTILPTLKSLLQLPIDRKLLVLLEGNLRKLSNVEQDKDVISALMEVSKKLDQIVIKHEGQLLSSKMNKLDNEDLKKFDEEKKIETMTPGLCAKKFSKVTKAGIKKNNFGEGTSSKSGKNEPETTSKSLRPLSTKGKQLSQASLSDSLKSSAVKNNLSTVRQTHDSSKSSTSSNNLTSNWARLASNSMLLEHPWEKREPSDSDNRENKLHYPYAFHDPCNCYKTSYIFQPQLRSTNLQNRSNFTKSTLLTQSDDDKHGFSQDFLLTRDNFDGGSKSPDFASLHALTNAAHYNSCWAFSSMPELPVTFLDDEFIIDAGIRIPMQLSTSQSTSRIPNLQDIIYRNKRTNTDRSHAYLTSGVANFQNAKAKNQDNKESKKQVSSTSISGAPSHKDDTRRSWHSENHQFSQGSMSNNYLDFPSKSDFSTSQGKSFTGMKRNSVIISRTKSKPIQSRNLLDRTKRHSMEVTDRTPVERRALRRYSTFDVNHNQGPSKIPLRSSQSGSRTAPATRASSPIRTEVRFSFQRNDSQLKKAQIFSQEGKLSRLTSSDEEVDKLCQKLLYSQTAPCSRATSPKSKDSKLPIRLQKEKL